jgi:hypothetical protein
MNPITSATVSGLGQSPLGAVEGSWVVGFFQDGADAQQPIIIGTLPGVPSELPTKGNNKGFQDEVHANYPKYKETDVNRLAVGDDDNPHSSLTIRRADRTVSVGRADFDPVDLGRANATAKVIEGDDGTNFNEPEAPYDAEYPHNHVYESEAGHIREIDDTPGAERIHERHANGTGYELHPNGDKVTRVKKDNYDLVYGQQFTHIRGNQSTTTNGGVKVFVNAAGAGGRDALTQYHYTIQVGKNANVNIQVDKGDVNVVTTQGDINLKSGKDVNIEAAQALRLKSNTLEAEVDGTWTEKVTGANTKTGKTINLN